MPLSRSATLLLLLASCNSPVPLSHACPQLGCDPDMTNFLPGFSPPLAVTPGTPRVAWETLLPTASTSGSNNRSQALCTSSVGITVLVCTVDGGATGTGTDSSTGNAPRRPPPAAAGDRDQNGTVGVDVATGAVLWGSASFPTTLAHPLVIAELGSEVFASDGSLYVFSVIEM